MRTRLPVTINLSRSALSWPAKRRKLTFPAVLIAVAVLSWNAIPPVVSAATITYYLDRTTPGQFRVLAQASAGDNFGIASYSVPLTGSITSIDHISPNTQFAQRADFVGGPAGFTNSRSADQSATLSASQDLITPTPHIIRGFGQEDSSFVEEGLEPLGAGDQFDWGVPLLIATGTSTGPVDFDRTSLEFSAVVLSTSSGAPTTEDANWQLVVIPEPASIVLASILLTVSLGIRRRRRP